MSLQALVIPIVSTHLSSAGCSSTRTQPLFRPKWRNSAVHLAAGPVVAATVGPRSHAVVPVPNSSGTPQLAHDPLSSFHASLELVEESVVITARSFRAG